MIIAEEYPPFLLLSLKVCSCINILLWNLHLIKTEVWGTPDLLCWRRVLICHLPRLHFQPSPFIWRYGGGGTDTLESTWPAGSYPNWCLQRVLLTPLSVTSTARNQPHPTAVHLDPRAGELYPHLLVKDLQELAAGKKFKVRFTICLLPVHRFCTFQRSWMNGIETDETKQKEFKGPRWIVG